MKYRKKPVVIEAHRLTKPMIVKTLEGVMTGNIGDWLITGVKGEKYFCKDDIFEMTYERAED
jgi:hypothetical protein